MSNISDFEVSGRRNPNEAQQNKKDMIHGTKHRINKAFPSKPYSKLKQTLIRMKDRKFMVQECVICIEPIRNDTQCRMLSCFHIFHSECVEKWLIENASCPMCAKVLVSKDDIKLDLKKHQMNSIVVDNECFFSDHIIVRKPDLLTRQEFKISQLCVFPGDFKHKK